MDSATVLLQNFLEQQRDRDLPWTSTASRTRGHPMQANFAPWHLTPYLMASRPNNAHDSIWAFTIVHLGSMDRKKNFSTDSRWICWPNKCMEWRCIEQRFNARLTTFFVQSRWAFWPHSQSEFTGICLSLQLATLEVVQREHPPMSEVLRYTSLQALMNWAVRTHFMH